jgi:predicted dehydrogenase
MTEQLRVGIIGVGNISPAYIQGCRAFDVLDLAACADIDIERAQRAATEHQIARAMSVDDLLAAPDIDLVINLTIPSAHADVSLRILAAGKHVYSEKPLAITLDDARHIMETAAAKSLHVGCAPDTFLFAPHQTARRLVDEGAIGKPIAAVGAFAGHGPESWHPNPDFFYARGAGPMLDIGVYPITCLVNLFGPASRVSGTAQKSFPERFTPNGRAIPVEVPTHYTGSIEFTSGAVATLITSFDMWSHRLPPLEVYGEKGSMGLPDPNGHHPRDVKLFVPNQHDWENMPLTYDDIWSRGIGVADMALGILKGRPYRASGELAYHVLEIMSAFETASSTGNYVTIHSQPPQPALLPLGLPPRQLD